jgi:hypothetical protein
MEENIIIFSETPNNTYSNIIDGNYMLEKSE